MAACLYAQGVRSQSELSLKDAVDEAVRTNPLLAVGQDRITVAEGFRQQAGLTLNPRLVLQSENTRLKGPPNFVYPRDTDNFAYLQQTLETSGKRARRVEVASAAVRRAELERELLKRQIAGRVKQSYWIAAGAWQNEQLLAANKENFRRIIEYHENRVKEGAMAEVDLIRVRLEGERLDIALTQATLEAERAAIQLQREMGRREFPRLRLTEALEAPPAGEMAGTAEEAIEARVEIRLARHMVDGARAALRLQESASRPNVDVLFGLKRTGGLDTMLGGVQVDLPFLNRNQGNIAAATAEIRAAESALAATEALVRAEVNAARREYEIRRRQIGESLRDMRQRADDAARIAEAAYREGGADLLRLLDAERLRIETQLLYFQSLAGYRQSIAALETALGVEP
jgi:outer membrane protein TolC